MTDCDFVSKFVMNQGTEKKAIMGVEAPYFLMWRPLEPDLERDWERQWFGHELNTEAVFNIRGIGIREPMFNANVNRPAGTGDWLMMLFHEAARLDSERVDASVDPMTLVIWEPGVPQFYSWVKAAGQEPHSWMHVEGTSVLRLIRTLGLPRNVPFVLPDASVMDGALARMLEEMREDHPDKVILQNLFENWARGVRRQTQPVESARNVSPALLRIRRYLDSDFRRIPPLDELAEMAAMSRSHLCHQFKECYGSSISEYVIRKRMAAAQRLLYDLELRPGDIAEAVGYPDIYQFSKQFKKSFGISPTRYRREQVQS